MSISRRAKSSSSIGPFDITCEVALDAIGAGQWNSLWQRSEAPTVFARYEWARAWCASWGATAQLQVFCAYQGGRLMGMLPIAIPAAQSEPAVLVGDSHADYAAILTDPTSPECFPALLDYTCASLPANRTLLLRDLRGDTSYSRHLRARATDTWSRWALIESTVCPRTNLTAERTQALLGKSSIRRNARQLEQLGVVSITHYQNAEGILPRLDAFFDQHVARWCKTRNPSLFLKEENRVFYRELARGLSGTGLLLFTEVLVDKTPVAFHFGFMSEGDFIWYKPSFNPSYSRSSPGEVMLAGLLSRANANGAAGFDFTRGDEPFKARFADDRRTTESYSFYRQPFHAAASRTAYRFRRALKDCALPPCLLKITGGIRNQR